MSCVSLLSRFSLTETLRCWLLGSGQWAVLLSCLLDVNFNLSRLLAHVEWYLNMFRNLVMSPTNETARRALPAHICNTCETSVYKILLYHKYFFGVHSTNLKFNIHVNSIRSKANRTDVGVLEKKSTQLYTRHQTRSIKFTHKISTWIFFHCVEPLHSKIHWPDLTKEHRGGLVYDTQVSDAWNRNTYQTTKYTWASFTHAYKHTDLYVCTK